MGTQTLRPVYLLDSVILIDHLRGIGPATKWLKKLREGEAVLSVITRAEVLSRGTADEQAAAHELCTQFVCLPLTESDATKAAELRRKHGWRLPDAFQASCAIRNGMKLVTRDARAFDAKKHPFVLIPYSL
ncbi:MAG: PIN domain-containing protein [Acidobacteriota bacterium]|nr:PIN domain-containing protein [Acidobacteriota bacterium]